MNLMMIDKGTRQDQGVEVWGQHRGRGTFLYYMRFGKTIAGLKVAQRVLNKVDDRICIIAVPSDIVRTTWINAIAAFSMSNQIDVNRIRIFTLHQLAQMLTVCDLLIVDEIHMFTSPEGKKIISKEKCVYKFILGLTGSYPSGDAKAFLDKHCPVIDYISKIEAVNNKWIADTLEYNISLELPSYDADRYIKHSEPIADTLSVFKDKASLLTIKGVPLFKDDYDLIVGCYAGKKTVAVTGGYIHASDIREKLAFKLGWNVELDLRDKDNQSIEAMWNPNNIHDRVTQFKQHVHLRNEIIINNQVKINATIEVLTINPVPTIVFSESTDFAEKLTDNINRVFPGKAVCYHSNIESRPILGKDDKYITTKVGNIKMFGKTKIKEDAIAGIVTGRYKYLITVKALDQGLDLPELEQVIITAGTLNPIQQTQRSARGSTIDINNIDKVATIVNLYFNDIVIDDVVTTCRDKVKLKARQVHNRTEVNWLSDIDAFKSSFNK